MLQNEVVLRLLVAVLLAAAGVGVYALANRWMIYRIRRRTRRGDDSAQDGILPVTGQKEPDPALTAGSDLPSFTPGIPAVLYFTTPQCVPCKTVQRPALQKLKEYLGDRLEVIEVNAQERPDLASRWGVLSVPTTFILDSRGDLRHINHGVTRAEALLRQVQGL